ncbi:MAG: hypothetical protein U5R31_12805 [Acidimicrobiia bacterium]|nr:hypothetical protein [Acidimicrobiia bacterium]
MARRLAQLADLPVGELKGVGAKKAAALERLDVSTVLDLLTYYPRRYLDRTREAADRRPHRGRPEALVLVKVDRCDEQAAPSRRTMVYVDRVGTGRLQLRPSSTSRGASAS